MAARDGSDYPSPSDDPNVYLLAPASNAAADPRTWDYYSTSGNIAHPRTSTGGYVQNNLPRTRRNRAFRNTVCRERPIYSQPVCENAGPSTGERSCFTYEADRPRSQEFPLYDDDRHGNYIRNEAKLANSGYPNSTRRSHPSERSQFRGNAYEYAPRRLSAQSSRDGANFRYDDYPNDNFRSSSHVFYSDDRNRVDDRRYDDATSGDARDGSYEGKGSGRRRDTEQTYGRSRVDADSATAIDREASSTNVRPDDASRCDDGKNSGTRNDDNEFANGRNAGNYREREIGDISRSGGGGRNGGTRPDVRREPGESCREGATSIEDSRDNYGTANNRGKWLKNEKRYRNDGYATSNRRRNDKMYRRAADEYEERQNFDSTPTSNSSTGIRREVSYSRESERTYRNANRAQRRRDDGSTNYNTTGPSHYDREGESRRDGDTGNKFDRFRDDDKKLRDTREEEIPSWRRKDKGPNRGGTAKKPNKIIEFDDDASQRERLTELLNQGQLECLICCDYVKQNDPVWSCMNCHHVLHLKCLKKWAHSSQSENGWRCPACQNVSLIVPEIYYCFCGKARAPEWNRRDVAHSCGEICGRLRAKNNCVHKCTLLCHPGACPECTAMVTRRCGCERTSRSLKCSTTTLVICEAICEKILNCRVHNCEKKCHHGDCGLCDKMRHQVCHCGKRERDVTCDGDAQSVYGCGEVCDKLLECGNHRCEKNCHPDSCGSCALRPSVATHCCCGQTPLTVERKTCLDPVPVCDKVCSKALKCGQPGDPHTCKTNCHPNECPECELTTKVRCRCGNMDHEIACNELRTKADDARCKKKCTKKRSCGKHKCNQLCCIDIEHVCPIPCTKSLNCGRHRCRLTCHKGRCQPCQEMSFDELHCECGSSVIYPPVPCGTRRPTCDRPCTRQHSCGHEVLHNCHSDPTCPPCTVLTQRWCYGKHELRKAVPCHVSEISCGLPCNKPTSCGRHKCITICHAGPCKKVGQVCVQPCATPREMCGHACAAPCHEGKCPDTPCKEVVKVTCTCGNRSMKRACAENSREFQRIASGILASKMADMQLGHSVDLEEVFGQGAKKQNQLKTLECNDECKIIARNRRIALGLQIVNPDVSGKLMPRYTETMKQWAKKDPHFCQMVHDKLTELVQLAKTSKQKSRSYSFDSMNRDKRNFIHESCEHFGCESQAYDQEPKRNVVATAVKDKCWLPSYSLLEIVQRENGQRKVPRPMLNSSIPKSSQRISAVLSSTAKASQKLQPTGSTSSKTPEPEIDYFDYTNPKANKWVNF